MFKKNLELLNNQQLKARLEKITLDESSKNISYCMTPSNDYLLLKNDVPMDDINNPREAIKSMLKTSIKNPMGNNDIIVTFGIGLCYLLDEVFNAYPSKIFVYEPDLMLLHFVLNNVDISEHLASGRVYITNDLNELMNKLSSTYLTKDKVEVVYLKNYAIVKSQELLELTQKVYETCKTKMIDINTLNKYSKRWLANSLKKIATINSSNIYKLSDLEGKFTGQTALIIAAGPSLNDNIEKIKANRDKFVIFAVNKVLRVLEANSITPDFAVCLDAADIDLTLAGLEDFCRKINCIADIKSDSVLFTKGFKRVFTSFSEDNSIVKKLAEFNPQIKTYEYGGSATTLAMVAAVKSGFSKIIFSGLDMAFKDDVMYSTGETFNKVADDQIKFYSKTKNLTKVKSVTGGVVTTRDDYAAAIHHFETLIRELDFTEIYNTTSFGAAIEGMKNVAFDNIPLLFSATGTPFILGEAKPFKIEIKDWAQNELHLINNIITILSKGTFSPALVSAIVKSSLIYQYMQVDIIKVLQAKFDSGLAEGFINNTKNAIKIVVDILQKNRLI